MKRKKKGIPPQILSITRTRRESNEGIMKLVNFLDEYNQIYNEFEVQ